MLTPIGLQRRVCGEQWHIASGHREPSFSVPTR